MPVWYGEEIKRIELIERCLTNIGGHSSKKRRRTGNGIVHCSCDEEVVPMKRIVKWLLIAWVALISLSAAEPMELSQVGKPEMIAVDQGLLYVLEGTTIHMYLLDKGEYLGNFGKDGEGPGEIKKNPFGGPILVVPFKGNLYVTSMGKLSIFSRTGEFIREYKVNASDSFYPFADRFVCMGTHEVSEGKWLWPSSCRMPS